MIRTLCLGLALLAAACGGKQPTPVPATMAAMEKPDHEMPAELAPFHDLLAPRWHAEKGAQRMTDTCAAVPQFQTAASEMAKPAAAEADTWATSSAQLTAAISGLEAPCTASDNDGFEAAFQHVHDSFHALLELAGVNHEQHAGGGEHADHEM